MKLLHQSRFFGLVLFLFLAPVLSGWTDQDRVFNFVDVQVTPGSLIQVGDDILFFIRAAKVDREGASVAGLRIRIVPTTDSEKIQWRPDRSEAWGYPISQKDFFLLIESGISGRSLNLCVEKDQPSIEHTLLEVHWGSRTCSAAS